jgi:hypothetical protein
MFHKNYTITLKNHLLYKNNLFNTNVLKFPIKPTLSTIFNTFKGEKNLKFIKLYLVVLYISNQKPFLKRVKFNYIKKKILKRFFISVSLNKKNTFNFFMYIINFYSYFFHIYYQKGLKYNSFNDSFVLYIDNIQFFFKNYNKQNQRTQIKLTFCSKSVPKSILVKYLNNLFMIKLKN